MSILGEIVQKMRAEGRGIDLKQFSQGATNGTTNGTTTATDPICNMTVSIADARYVSTYQDNTFYFCCANCKEAFDQDPQRTLPQAIG
jgi:YHS domain-containing protein